MRRKILAAFAVALILVIGILPIFIRWRVNSALKTRYPDVKVEFVELRWGSVLLHKTTFDRGWVSGTLDLVTVAWDEKTIAISGGSILADLDKRPSTAAHGERRGITAEHIAGKVTRGNMTASFDDLRFSADGVDVPEVIVEHPKLGRVLTKNVTYASNVVTAEEVTLMLPEFAGHNLGQATLHHVEGRILSREVRASDATIPNLGLGLTTLIVEQEEDDHYNLHAGELRVDDGRLAAVPVTFANVELEANPGTGLVQLKRDGEALVHADVKNRSLTGEAPCSTWLDFFPPELRAPALSEMMPGFTGHFSFEVKTQPKVAFTFRSTCKTTCDFPVLKALRKTFTYPIRKIDGSPGMLKTGPTDRLNWAPLAGVSRHMVTALTTLEDPGFFGHRGIVRQAIENSIRDDLKADRFLRGGSTLTMQLAKNLWLTSEKTLGRKAQEAFLTMALEGCLSKDEILTLYLNVVEFGRGLYGITPAAMHYFKVAPSDLTPEEAFYLVSILPHPRTAPPPTEATMTRIKSMMSRFAEEGRIPDLLGEPGQANPSGWEPSP